MVPKILGVDLFSLRGYAPVTLYREHTDKTQSARSYIALFERVAGSLECITHLLPDYENLLAINQERHRGEQRLTPLSYLISDITQFLSELHQMFSRACHGMYNLRTISLSTCDFVIPISISPGGHNHIGYDRCWRLRKRSTNNWRT